jgi:hypothetical protein
MQLVVPNSWGELVALAKQLNGTDWNGDGMGDFAVCFDTKGYASLWIFQRWAKAK